MEPLTFGALALALTIASTILDSISCKNKADLMNMNWNYGITTGCMIEHRPNEYIPIKQYRAN